jgi:uncharacterized protein (DUF305 family)
VSLRPRPQPPTGLTLVALVLALCFLAGAAGWYLRTDRPPGRDSVDVGFLYDMIAHHEQAIELSQIELFAGENRDAMQFAEEILRFQSYEIGLMDQMLEAWGHAREEAPTTAMAWMGHATPVAEMPGMASPTELDRLRDAEGTDTDAVFLALMADHHAGGVGMAEAAAAEASDGDVRALAERIARAQRFEIEELVAAAVRGGLDRTPDGVEVSLYDPRTAELTDAGEEHGTSH